MDDVEHQAIDFHKSTLMSCYDDVVATAGAVEERLNAILPQARTVIEFLDSRLHDLFTDPSA